MAQCHWPKSRQSITHIASLEKDQNSKLEAWFLLNVYHFHTTLKLKNRNQGPSVVKKKIVPE